MRHFFTLVTFLLGKTPRGIGGPQRRCLHLATGQAPAAPEEPPRVGSGERVRVGLPGARGRRQGAAGEGESSSATGSAGVSRAASRGAPRAARARRERKAPTARSGLDRREAITACVGRGGSFDGSGWGLTLHGAGARDS